MSAEVFNLNDWVKVVPDSKKTYLPGSDKYFVEVRRMSRKESLQRANLSTVEVRKEALTREALNVQQKSGYADVEKKADLVKFKFYMYYTCITDYSLPVCISGQLEDRTFQRDALKGAQTKYNETTYDLMDNRIADWIDGLINEINGETEEEEENVRKAEDFLEESSGSPSSDQE